MTSTGGEVQAVAQGAGVGGVGGMLDLETSPATPTDTFEVSAISLLHKRSATDQFEQYVLGASSVTAQGAGTVGVGVLVAAAGDDTYRALSQGAVASTTAQGGAMIGGGVLVDGDGDDTMAARALGDTTLGLITTDPNACWRVVVDVHAGSTVATGQGGASLGAAILVDAGGDDARVLSADSTAGAIAEATSNHPCADNTAEAFASSGGAILLGQGAGRVDAGTLVDLGGNDVNNVSAGSLATARAIATSSGTNHEIASATVGDAGTEAQGYGFTGLGVLADA